MRPIQFALPLILIVAACKVSDRTAPDAGAAATAPAAIAANPAPNPMAARDTAAASPDLADSEPRPIMQAQVVLDRLGFTPGVVDGKLGLSTRNAISGFQEANGLAVTGALDPATTAGLAQWTTIPATRVVVIPAEFAAGPFVKLPKSPQDQAKLSGLGYETLDEKLAERFHTTVDTLKLLNPGGKPASAGQPAAATASPSAAPSATATTGPVAVFAAGQQIRVPNVGGDAIPAGAVSDQAWQTTLEMLGVGSTQPQADKIVVSKSKGTLKAYDAAGKLVAVYTATMGSSHDPLPLGDWKITGVGHNPPFNYNPKLFWDAKAGSSKATLPPGPNGPLGPVPEYGSGPAKTGSEGQVPATYGPSTAAPIDQATVAYRADSVAVAVAAPSLVIPVQGVAPGQLTDTFAQAREGGARVHDAIDIMAPRGTPVLAAAAGTIEALHLSAAGGLTIYLRCDDRRFVLYYAHLDGYAAGLAAGQQVSQGQVV